MRRFHHKTRLQVEVLEDRCVPTYAISDLGATLAPQSINNAGLIAGAANGHAALWQDGTILELGTLGGATSQANDLNEAGQVVGYADTSGGTRHAFLVTPEDTDSDGQADRWFRDDDTNGINDLMLDLGTLGGPTSEARGINNLGQIVGRADLSTAGGSYRAFLWDSVAGMRDLGTFGGNASEANAINERGDVAGSAYSFLSGLPHKPNGIQGFRWDAASGGTLLGSLLYSARKATDINDAGQIVGNSGYLYALAPGPNPNYYRATDAFLWQGGVSTSLGFTNYYPNPGDPGFDVSINNHAQVVGLNHVWQEGLRTDLNTLVDPGLGWAISQTSDINDAAQIVGQGTHQGVSTSFLLSYVTPTQPPSLSIGDVSVTEGDAGTVNAVFTVNLSRPALQTVTVDFATAAGTAATGSDYTATSGTLTFAPGELSKTITVSVNGDTRDEYDESLYVNLDNAVNASVADGQGLGTIVDNDPPPSLTINDVAIVEGNSGITYAVFTVTLSAASGKTISVNFATANGTATTSNNDYVATSGTLTFAPDETTKSILVAIKGNTKKEANETFYVNLSGAVDATILDGQGLGTILNDD